MLTGKHVGEVAVLRKGNRWIYYLITKPKFSRKPTYKTLELALRDMKEHIIWNGVRLKAVLFSCPYGTF
jgi:hypothetical protein